MRTIHSGASDQLPFQALVIDDDASRRETLRACLQFIELECHVFDFVSWLQQGKGFSLDAIGVVLIGESSLPIALNKLVAELDRGVVIPKLLTCDWPELDHAAFAQSGILGVLEQPYRYPQAVGLAASMHVVAGAGHHRAACVAGHARICRPECAHS